jgi:hypothetical protein
MYKPKYIIADGSAIIFSAAIQHSDMAKGMGRIDGAGFVDFRTEVDSYGETIIKAFAYGKSTSLGIESRPEQDSMILTRQITNVFG